MFNRWMLYNLFKMLLKHTPRIQDLANSTVWVKDSPTNRWILWDPSSLFPKLINPVLVSPSALRTLWRWLWNSLEYKTENHNTLSRKVSLHNKTSCYVFLYLSIISLVLAISISTYKSRKIAYLFLSMSLLVGSVLAFVDQHSGHPSTN